MKKIILLLSSIISIESAIVAQTTVVGKPDYSKVKNFKAVKTKYSPKTGFEALSAKVSVPPSASARALGKTIGITNYDLGSNGSVKPRLINQGNGKISAAFTYGTGDISAGVTDRGSGYNTSDASGKFGNIPTKRVENLRTGFTNLAIDGDGTEYLFAHSSDYVIIMSKKAKNATNWTQSDVPTTLPAGCLWPSVAIGGANGKTIHLIAVATPTDFSGTIIDDIDGPLVYFRSKDGGATWDKQGILLPGVDGTRYNDMGADCYSVAVKGDKVAIGYYGNFADTEIWISNDNGDNFTRRTIWDFPLPNYKIDDLYTTSQIPPSPISTDSLAIESSDSGGSVFIDNNGKAHLIMPSMIYTDAESDSGAYTYYPGTSGMYHWDENTPDSLYFFNPLPDPNEDGNIDITDFAIYYRCLTSWPSLAQGSDGTLYMAYTAPAEDFLHTNGVENSRHVYIIASKDGGKTWTKPFDVIADPTLLDANSFLIDAAEITFPYLAQNIDANLHLIYQLDYTTHLHVQHPTSVTVDYEDNEHVYTAIPLTKIIKSKDAILPSDKVKIYPNPTTDVVNINLGIGENKASTLTITDLTGKIINVQEFKNSNSIQTVNIAHLPTGTYFFTVRTDDAFRTERIVKF